MRWARSRYGFLGPNGAGKSPTVRVLLGLLAAAVVTADRRPRSRVLDLLIAATAPAHSARLYTRNARDPGGIEHLVEIAAV